MDKRWRKVFLLAAAPVALVIGLTYWLLWSGTTDHIVSVANQFKADSSWKLVTDRADPPKTLCIAQTCPNLTRVWTMEKPVSQEKLVEVIASSGWTSVKIEDGCESKAHATGSEACWMHGSVEGYEITIAASTESPSLNMPKVSLFMK